MAFLHRKVDRTQVPHLDNVLVAIEAKTRDGVDLKEGEKIKLFRFGIRGLDVGLVVAWLSSVVTLGGLESATMLG